MSEKQTYIVDFAQYLFLIPDIPPVEVSKPPTKDQCYAVFSRMIRICPPRMANGGLRPRWPSMDVYISEMKRLTIDLIHDATHDRAIEEMEDEALRAYIDEGGTVTDWENLNVGCRVDQALPGGNLDTRQPGYEVAYRTAANEAIQSVKAGTFRELMQRWWPWHQAG